MLNGLAFPIRTSVRFQKKHRRLFAVTKRTERCYFITIKRLKICADSILVPAAVVALPDRPAAAVFDG